MIATFEALTNMFPETKITLGSHVQHLVDKVSKLSEFTWAYEAEQATFKTAP